MRPTEYITGHLDTIPGWFDHEDAWLFNWILDYQENHTPAGDLAELGVYLGRSAVLLGLHRRPEETFTVCDLFEGGGIDAANDREQRLHYPVLTRDEFLRNYTKFVVESPTVIAGPTSSLQGVVPAGKYRFVHIDASHLYRHVAGDIDLAARMLRDEGIVVIDDYRTAHTPGVAAATWAAVKEGLNPVVLTSSKFYGTWGDPERLFTETRFWVSTAGWEFDVQDVAGQDVLRVPRRPQRLDRRERLERALLPGTLKWRLDERRRRTAAATVR